jgi:hypothetical protein
VIQDLRVVGLRVESLALDVGKLALFEVAKLREVPLALVRRE